MDKFILLEATELPKQIIDLLKGNGVIDVISAHSWLERAKKQTEHPVLSEDELAVLTNELSKFIPAQFHNPTVELPPLGAMNTPRGEDDYENAEEPSGKITINIEENGDA